MRDRGDGDAGSEHAYARWAGWLVAGTLAGLLAGFAVGLGRPRRWSYGPDEGGGPR